MKKIIITLLTILLCCSFVFAEDASTEASTVAPIDYSNEIDNFAFLPTMSRYNAMGQSGLAAAGRIDTFYSNPAALAERRFGLSLPSVAFTMYNVQKILADKNQRDLIAAIFDGSDEDAAAKLGEQLIKNLGNGYNVLAKVDASVGLAVGSFGFGTNAQVKLHTTANGTSNLTNTTIIPEVNVAQTVAFGLNLIKTNSVKLQAGVSAHFVYKAYLEGQNANTILKDGEFQDISDIMWTAPLMGGYAVPFDAGLTLAFADDAVRFSVTANNLNGIYYMKSYSSTGDFINTMANQPVMEVPDEYKTRAEESVDFQISTPWTLNAGFAFAPNIIFNPVLSVDVVDILGMSEEMQADDFQTQDLLLHLNAGVEFTVAVLNLRAGINRGYASIGAGVGILGIRIDAAYGWQEFGQEIGDKPVDSFTIRFNIGYDK